MKDELSFQDQYLHSTILMLQKFSQQLKDSGEIHAAFHIDAAIRNLTNAMDRF